MPDYHEFRFPGESEEYRKARNELLRAEMDLRRQIEEVAELRRKLPFSGPLKEDYVFEEGAADPVDEKTVRQTRFSELFLRGKDSLIVYSFMFPPDGQPCPMCNSLLDGLNGIVPHAIQRVNFVVVAKAPIKKLREWARSRGWNNHRLLSSEKNTYNRDYFGEDEKDGQWPSLNVFRKADGGIFHFYHTELLLAPNEEGQNARHVDQIWPLWNLFDLTPEGRGKDWFPKLSYQ